MTFRNLFVSKLFYFLDGFGFSIVKIWYRKKVSDSASEKFGIGKVSDSVSKKIGIGKSFGFDFVQIWGILSNISVSVLEKFGIGKKFRIQFCSDFMYRHTLIHI